MSNDLVNWVLLAPQECGLEHLLLGEFGLEADVRNPVTLAQTHFREVIVLTVVKFAKESFFDLIDVLNFHLLRYF